MRPSTWALASGVLLGVGVGRLVAGRQRRRHGRALYDPRPQVRLTALGWLSGHPSAASLTALRDWLDWEPLPALQRRGTVVLGRMAAAMGQGDAA